MAQTAADEDNSCFICLSNESSAELGPLGRHCQCPSLFSHRSCLTRWQLQNAGKQEEKQCRFCHTPLGDWRTALTEVPSQYRRNAPIMAVVFQGKTIKVPVVTGPEGVAEFKRTVCKLFNLPEGTDFEVTFECKSPVFGDKLHLKGFDCFEAASYCAAVSAAKRATTKAARAAATPTDAPNSNPTTTSPRPNSRPSRPSNALSPPRLSALLGSRSSASAEASTSSAAPSGSSTPLATTSSTTGGANSSNQGEGTTASAGLEVGSNRHSKSGCSPSFVRRLLCGARKHQTPHPAMADMQQQQQQQQLEQQQQGSPTVSAAEDGQSSPFVSTQDNMEVAGTTATMVGVDHSDRMLPSMQSDAPQAHVATTSGIDGGEHGGAGGKAGRPLGASLASLFKRVM